MYVLKRIVLAATMLLQQCCQNAYNAVFFLNIIFIYLWNGSNKPPNLNTLPIHKSNNIAYTVPYMDKNIFIILTVLMHHHTALPQMKASENHRGLWRNLI